MYNMLTNSLMLLLVLIGLLLFCLAYYSFVKKDFRVIGTLIGSLGLLFVAAGGGLGVPIVLNNAQLAWLSSSQSLPVIRLGFNLPGDGGWGVYRLSATACSLNSGNGDNGAQTKLDSGGCGLLQPQALGYDVRIWGCLVDGQANDSVCQRAANTAISTLFGGGKMLIPATGNCLYGQDFTAGNTALGTGVILEGSNVGACLKLQDNATQPLFQTPNAYLYMQRKVTSTVTQATTSMPVGETPPLDIGPGQTIFVIDNTGVARRGITANPAVSGSNVLISSWIDGSFTAAADSWWGDLNHVGPPNSGLRNLLLNVNAAPVNVSNPVPKQPYTNSLVATIQTVTAGSNLSLVGGTPKTLTPYANLPVEFGSDNDLSGVTFTVTCDMIRQDFSTVSITTARTGPNKNKVPTPETCHRVTQIAVSGGTATGVTVGWSDGSLSGDGVVVYAPMFRLDNVLVQSARGWCFRTGFVPGTGFNSPAPGGGNWQTQENYLNNPQCMGADTGGYWNDGPNDSRLFSFTNGFAKWVGLWFGRWCGGCNADHVHISGGNTGQEAGVREAWIGILIDADTVTCIECKSEESWINILLRANSSVITEHQVFHFNDTASNRVGIQIGDTNYNTGKPVTGYRLRGEAKRQGGGAIKFVNDGGFGNIDEIVFNDGPFAGDLPYNGTPRPCTTGGSYIRLLDGVTPVNSYHQYGPCPAWTPSMNFGGIAPAQTSSGEWQENRAQGRITLNANPGTGAVTITGFPSSLQPTQTCPIIVPFVTASGLTGSVSGYLQGGTATIQQSAAAGTAAIIETGTPTPFVSGTNFFFTAGPCIQ